MKHRVTGRKFSRKKGPREAMIKTLLGSIIVRERVTTTEAKAKEAKPKIDRLITKAKKMKADPAKSTAVIRDLRKHLPLPAVKKLCGEFLDRFKTRQSGYTRITKLEQRKSDGARMAVIEFV